MIKPILKGLKWGSFVASAVITFMSALGFGGATPSDICLGWIMFALIHYGEKLEADILQREAHRVRTERR